MQAKLAEVQPFRKSPLSATMKERAGDSACRLHFSSQSSVCAAHPIRVCASAFSPTLQGIRRHNEGWLDLDRAASVEVISEEKNYGIDAALVSGETQGWRAANTGTQTIRLLFDHPQRLRRISLVFEETRDKAYPRVCLAMVCG